MLRFIFQKLLNKKWLVLCILIGNILLVGIACCNPMYTRAALQKMLTKNMNQSLQEENRYPCMEVITAKLSDTRLGRYGSTIFSDYLSVPETVEKLYEIEPIESVTLYDLSNAQEAKFETERATAGSSALELKLAALSDMEEHVEIISGEMYSAQPDAEGVIDCIVNETVYLSTDMIIGETIALKSYTDLSGEPVRLRICGVFRAKDTESTYWVKDPLSYEEEFFIDQSLYEELFMKDGKISGNITASWYTLFDYTSVEIEEVEQMLAVHERLSNDYAGQGQLYTPVSMYEETFRSFQSESGRISRTMWILQVPILVLLAVFIFMVSNQVITIEAGEIAMLKSRGVSRRQLIGTYFFQSLFLALIALVIGIPLGVLLCHVFGSANAFLEFVGRQAMKVKVTGTALLFALLAALAGVLIMTLPVLKYARFSIVEQKANKRKAKRPMWQRLFLDFALLAISLYGFYNFNSQTDLLIQKVADGEALDPMLFLSASLFILSCAICFLRVIPLLSYVIFRLGRKFWRPAAYASFLQITRDSRKQSFITVFLVLTIALGIFNANIARTVNENEEIRLRYDNGADVVLQEKWPSNESSYQLGYVDELVYQEPSFERYEKLQEENPDRLVAMAKVLVDNVEVNIGRGTFPNTMLMAIHTKDFGNTAWMPDGYTESHWFNDLNALSQRPDGAIISSNLAESTGLEVGSTFTIYRWDYQRQGNNNQKLTVVAVVDLWPGYEDKRETVNEDGGTTLEENFLVVTNLENLLRDFDVRPYEVWMHVDGSTDFIYDWAEENGIKLQMLTDTSADIQNMKNDPYFQVTNGMLTITFIVVILICAIGFLIYWLTSIRSRELIFGIYRAMGMSMRELIAMLINEHLFGSVLPILFGAGVGIVASKLFVPLIEIAYSPTIQTLEVRTFSSNTDMIRIGVVVCVMLLVCIGAISVLLSKIKINQALKLGED
ncbi:MAG: FtsX-like permease family protein [Lachnospiraceae bacterium]|nr:FtsX-like permease family protein [Lachnospiraceae bacterium]